MLVRIGGFIIDLEGGGFLQLGARGTS